MVMPEMSGREMMEEILEINPEMPFIILTGFSYNEDLEKLREKASFHQLGKPFSVVELLSLIRQSC